MTDISKLCDIGINIVIVVGILFSVSCAGINRVDLSKTPVGETAASESLQAAALHAIKLLEEKSGRKGCTGHTRDYVHQESVDDRGGFQEQWVVKTSCGNQFYLIVFNEGLGRVSVNDLSNNKMIRLDRSGK